MARKAIITTFDWAQDSGASITGGGWEDQLPASNMLTLQPQLVAQSTSAGASFNVDLGATRSIGLIHLQRLITDPGGTIQVTAGGYDSGVVSAWPSDLAGVYPPLLQAALGRQRVFIPPAPVDVGSVSININGVSTPLQIGYVGVCEILEFPDDMLIGNVRTVIDESDVQYVPFGSVYVNFRAKRRRLDFATPPLDENNGDYYKMSDLGLINGQSSPVVVSKFPDNINDLERNTIWGLLTTAQTFTNSFYAHSDAAFQITQLV